MTIIDINRGLAVNAIIDVGRAIDRLKKLPPEALAKAAVLDEGGLDRRGDEVIREMALVLYALHDAVRAEAQRARADVCASKG